MALYGKKCDKVKYIWFTPLLMKNGLLNKSLDRKNGYAGRGIKSVVEDNVQSLNRIENKPKILISQEDVELYRYKVVFDIRSAHFSVPQGFP